MAATLGCNTTRVLCNAPLAGTRNAGEPSTSSISRFHLRGRRANKNLSLKLGGRQGANKGISLVRASLSNEGDKVRELASEKAVDSGQQVAQDTKKLANQQSPVVLDAKVEDASDAASYESDVREGVVDVASDMAVDVTDDVDALAKKDAAPLADTYGRSVEDTAEALEAKAAEISDREAIKESGEPQNNSGSFFTDQVIKEEMLDVASTTAVDEGPEVEATAQKDASDMTDKVGGDLRRNKATIQGLADTASKLEADRSGGLQQIGDQFEGLKRTISKNLKEGIDSNRPGLEELSRTASKRVKAGQEYLDDAADGAVDISGDAQAVIEDAKGAIDKRQSAINLAVEDARETGSLVAELAAKGWDALSKTTEKFVAKFQKNVGELQVTAQEKAEEAKERAGVTADQAQSKFAEAKQKAEEAADQAQKQFAEAQNTLQAKTDELRDAAQEKASESKSNLQKAVDEAQRKFDEARDNMQAKTGELKDTTQEKASEARSKLEGATDEAQSKFGEAKENVQTKTGELKDKAQEKASEARSKLEGATDEAQSKFGEAKENVQTKAGEVKDTAEEKASQSKSKLEGATDEAQSKFGEAKENVQTKAGEVKDTAEEKASQSKSKLEGATDEAQSKFGEAKENVQTKAGEVKDTAEEKASQSKSKLEDAADAAQSKAGDLSSSAQEKAGDAQGSVESKVGDVKKELGKSNGQSNSSESRASDPTPGAEASVEYADSGKVNDEWKGKAQ